MTERRCQGCGTFHPKDGDPCPHCGKPPVPINKALVMAGLNSALYQEAARAIATA